MSKSVCCTYIVFAILVCASISFAETSTVRVLFDQGHDQRFLIEETGDLQLSGFASIIRERGVEVKSTKKVLTDEILNDYKAIVISGPFEALSPEEVAAVVRFIERGGRLAAMLHIGSPLGALLNRLDMDHSNAVLRERRNVIDTDINFRVKDLTSDPLFSGVNHYSTFGAWALNPGKSVKSIARTSAESWVDLNGDKVLSEGDAVGPFSVAVSGTTGKGAFVFFADDAIFQNRYLDENNRKLATNLALWLSGQ